MTCNIKCHMESHYHGGSNMFAGGGVSVAVATCETHGWRFPEGQTVGAGDLCPIGQIEGATEKAIKQIEAVKDTTP